ncbi:hypothetical protein [Saudi moumouvirus]|uniref:Uncharacterized protein n=1 Tax=Moumouvirus sp. 'Monve' TaxID=1128131 RepID=H2EFJ5_9VIRU|nr:hypothetical protein mv_R1058 [Moumouvirus Monve]AQN67934.1 hypothetical protein [Saudi moumouvirus]
MSNKIITLDLINIGLLGAVIRGSYAAGFLAGKENAGEYINSTNYYYTIFMGACVGAVGSCALAGGLVLATKLFSKLVR